MHVESAMTAEPAWNAFMTERDRLVHRESALGTRAGFGRRPALLIIDASYDFVGEKSQPLMESIKRWPLSSGEEGWNALRHIGALRDAAHAKRAPVIYTTAFFRDDRWDAGGWAWKTGRSAEWPRDSAVNRNDIVAQIAPHPQDIVILKQKPSGFFGTNLASYLTLLGCDSVIVVGGTTSGCVRATVVDAFSFNYRVAVPEQACFDRFQASHAVGLYDMNAKYADVVSVSEALAFYAALPSALFNLPAAPAGK
jgi:maleamate amidohydrolase